MFAASKTSSVSGGYQISRSLRFNSADTTYLNRTPASAGNRKTWTYSTWMKLGVLGTNRMFFSSFASATDTQRLIAYFDTNNRLSIDAATTAWRTTTQVFRDTSAWYHIVFAFDTTQATANDRIKLYINGSQVTAFDITANPTQNADTAVNATYQHDIGARSNANDLPYDGYITETYLIDGQALTPSSFGETNAQTGVWQPKAYSGSYGTNGFYLNFSDNSNTTAATLGKDYSGNGNNWTPNNFSVTAGAGNDSLVDSPTSYGTDTGVGGTVRGNYNTWNPVAAYGSSAANGNLDATVTGSGFGGNGVALGSISVSSGKWYWEVTPISGSGYMIGISDVAGPYNNRSYNGVYGWGYYFSNGQKYTSGAGASYGATYTTNDVIGIALDMDAGTITFYKNGTSQGVAYTSLNTGRSVTPMVSDGSGLNNQVYYANFGQRPFAYTAPSGFKALCTQNLPTPTIGATTATQAGKYFNAVTWTGDSTNPRTITGVGFQPDLVWAKGRSAATSNFLQDAVRGVTSTNSRTLVSNNTDAETNYYTLNGGVTAFASDGFTTSGGSTNANLNNTGSTFVAWNWLANGSGSTNTSGSITSTVSANTTSGFSVVTYTNASSGTVGHGLGVAPAMVIYKDRTNNGVNWIVLHQSLTNMSNYYLTLNTTNAAASGITLSANPTSSVIYTNTNIIQNSAASVAYCFAEVAGYSKFGSYTGNGSSTDGPFVYTGFRPAYVLLKRTTDTSADYVWWVMDSKRGPYNATAGLLNPNNSNAENSAALVDFLSNGFKVRNGSGSVNANGVVYIYAAFAEAPQKFSLAR